MTQHGMRYSLYRLGTGPENLDIPKVQFHVHIYALFEPSVWLTAMPLCVICIPTPSTFLEFSFL